MSAIVDSSTHTQSHPRSLAAALLPPHRAICTPLGTPRWLGLSSWSQKCSANLQAYFYQLSTCW